MRHVRRAAVSGLFALWLAPLPVLAGSESSNASGTCSNGHSTRADSRMIEDRQGRHAGMRGERWREAGPRPGRDDED